MSYFPPVLPFHFAAAMEARWTSDLKNKASPALRNLWTHMAGVFGDHILRHDDPADRTKWAVIDPPTGSGKTQGIMTYCSMMANLPADQQPGVLIVTRLIQDADSIAAEINKQSNKTNYAVSHHSAKPLALDTLKDYSVLVITHSAYGAAMSSQHDEHAFHQTWPYFFDWQGVGRRLVVVDEAPNLVEQFDIGLDELRQTHAALPQAFRDEYPVESKVFGDLVENMESVATDGKCSEKILPRFRCADGGRGSLTTLTKAMRSIPFDEQSGLADAAANQRLYKTHCDRAKAVQNLMAGDMYYVRVQGKHVLNSSRLVVPEGIKGAVVLDATASVNVMYELFDKASVLPMTKGVRSYKNVRLYVNREQNVGKDHLAKHIHEILPPILADLSTKVTGRNIFIATHKDISQKVIAATSHLKREVGTWGRIDGSNAWKDCDTALIMGLRYMPDSWTANTFFALQGMRDTDWLQNKARPFGKHRDIRSALKTGQMTAEVIQAINRLCCRQVNDSEGNCPDAEVYLLLPEGTVGDNILTGITGLMEGVVIKPWIVEGFEPKTTCRGRPSGTGAAMQPLLQALSNMQSGTKIKTSDLTELTKLSSSTVKRFIADFKKETTTSIAILRASDVSYIVEGKGRNANSYFMKA